MSPISEISDAPFVKPDKIASKFCEVILAFSPALESLAKEETNVFIGFETSPISFKEFTAFTNELLISGSAFTIILALSPAFANLAKEGNQRCYTF